MKYVCATCGEEHDELPDLGYAAPIYYDSMPEAERGPGTRLTPDLCELNGDYFVRGVIELPIQGTGERFGYGVWLSLSEKNFRRYEELFDETDPPPERYVGWISNRIPGYPDTTELKGAATLRSGRLRPTIELEPTDHPLAVYQREGIPLEAVIEICSKAVHGE